MDSCTYWATSARQFETVRVTLQRGQLSAKHPQPLLDPRTAASVGRRLVINTGDGFGVDRSGRCLVLESVADTDPPPLGVPVVVIRRAMR